MRLLTRLYGIYLYGVAGILDTGISLLCCNEEGVAQCCMLALSTITYLARYAEVHSALQPAGEAARYGYS